MFVQISSLFLTEITWDENYPYILIRQGPCWIVIAKEDWLLCFRSNTIILEHSEILGWRIAKYGKIIFHHLFQKKSVILKTSSILFDFYWNSLLTSVNFFVHSLSFVCLFSRRPLWGVTVISGLLLAAFSPRETEFESSSDKSWLILRSRVGTLTSISSTEVRSSGSSKILMPKSTRL